MCLLQFQCGNLVYLPYPLNDWIAMDKVLQDFLDELIIKFPDGFVRFDKADVDKIDALEDLRYLKNVEYYLGGGGKARLTYEGKNWRYSEDEKAKSKTDIYNNSVITRDSNVGTLNVSSSLSDASESPSSFKKRVLRNKILQFSTLFLSILLTIVSATVMVEKNIAVGSFVFWVYTVFCFLVGFTVSLIFTNDGV